jgi:predicted DNA binding CopG/RHH family protein
MPKSRNRKNHKKKVANRNQVREGQAKNLQKIYNEKLIEHLKQMHEEYVNNSGSTETETDGFIQPTDNTEL